MKKHTIRFDLRYRQSHMIGIGSVAICNLFIWAYYWLTQSKKLFPDGMMILPFVILPVLWFLYVYRWKIAVTDREFIIYRLFRRRKRYSFFQIKKVVAFNSYAENGTVIWIRFSDGKWLKVSNAMQNFNKLHLFLLKKCTIEWK